MLSLTVYFEEPFWIGVFESVNAQKLSVCKITFGAEPKDCDVFEFILSNFNNLKFSRGIKIEQRKIASNPKRDKRNAKKQLSLTGIGTKSQQALALEREAQKTERKKVSKEQRETEKNRQFELKQQKLKEKRKGH